MIITVVDYLNERGKIMANNKGKEFEAVVKQAFEKMENVSIDRFKDTIARQKDNKNPSDFVVYKKPYEYYVECKTTTQNTLNFNNIRQWDDLVEKSKIKGVIAGVLVWFRNQDKTIFVPIQSLVIAKENGCKSIHYMAIENGQKLGFTGVIIPGKKKRVYFDYDMDAFFHYFEKEMRKHG